MPADHGANKAPAYQWYPRDFEGDELVKLMSLEEEGAYRRLLDHQWLHGSIPDDVRLLGKICKNTPAKRMSQIWRAVAACFVEVEPRRLQNRKMERVRTLSREHRDRQRAAGKLGAEARWGLRNPDVGSDGDGMATPLAGAMETPMASERPDHGSATADDPPPPQHPVEPLPACPGGGGRPTRLQPGGGAHGEADARPP